MDDIVKKIDTPEKCDIYAKNCVDNGRKDLAIQAKRRAFQLRAELKGANTEVEKNVLEVVYAYEDVRSAINGKKTYARRTWRMIREYGIIGAVERAVIRRSSTQGYKTLVEMGYREYTFERVVIRHPHSFSPEALEASQERIRKRGDE